MSPASPVVLLVRSLRIDGRMFPHDTRTSPTAKPSLALATSNAFDALACLPDNPDYEQLHEGVLVIDSEEERLDNYINDPIPSHDVEAAPTKKMTSTNTPTQDPGARKKCDRPLKLPTVVEATATATSHSDTSFMVDDPSLDSSGMRTYDSWAVNVNVPPKHSLLLVQNDLYLLEHMWAWE